MLWHITQAKGATEACRLCYSDNLHTTSENWPPHHPLLSDLSRKTRMVWVRESCTWLRRWIPDKPACYPDRFGAFPGGGNRAPSRR
jgi:hypothetical protein